MSLTITINFRWNRDETWEAMFDKELDSQAKKLIEDKLKDMNCSTLRECYHAIRQDNELRADKELVRFMMEEYEGVPRYVAYTKEILTYAVYDNEHHDLNPANLDDFKELVTVLCTDAGVTVRLKIPKKNKIPNQRLNKYVEQMNEFHEILSDTMWGGSPGSEAVHTSLSTIDFRAW